MADGRIPLEIIAAVEGELDKLKFGSVSLTIQLHDGRPRYIICKERSIILDKSSSGASCGE
jgi:hypothetical protein